MIAARQIFLGTSQGNKEEEMYKEMFRALVCNVPQGETVRLYDPDITFVGPHFLDNRSFNQIGIRINSGNIAVDFPNVTQIGCGGLGNTFSTCNLVSVNLPSLIHAFGGYNFLNNNCMVIELPLLQSFNNHEFSYSSTLKTLRLPSVTSKSGAFFVYSCSALEHVYLPKMSLAALGGASYIAQQQCNSAAVFHLQDGDYDYQGNPISA